MMPVTQTDQRVSVEDPLAEDPEPPEPIWYVPPPQDGPSSSSSKTLNMRRVTKRQLQVWREEADPDAAVLLTDRPRTRGDCVGGERPCPYVGCKHHLYLDVNEDTGSITFNFPDKAPDELEHSCALDVADEGGATLEVVGGFFNVTRERIRQIEARTLKRLRKSDDAREMFADGVFPTQELSSFARAQDEEGDVIGGGSACGELLEDPEVVEVEAFVDNVSRIYERTSRERSQGVRPDTSLPVTLAASPPVQDAVVVAATVPEITALTPREQRVVDAYLDLATRLKGRPSPLTIAWLLELEGDNNSLAANVCGAIASARAKGVNLPYADKKVVKKSEQEKLMRVREKRQEHLHEVTTPVEGTGVNDSRPTERDKSLKDTHDELRNMLLQEREKLLKKLAAVEMLLQT